ncbi:hypothetical protein BGZ91_000213 [Linnemannia elongata]|nr:hypothetical protein BGZ91_000213 [Linnemannia elongata]
MSSEKEQAEINDALAEEENLRVHTENNNLKEWLVWIHWWSVLSVRTRRLWRMTKTRSFDAKDQSVEKYPAEYRKELEKNNVLSVQHKVEEEMSQALIRECPKCKTRFFKTEGCNKMTCPQCHTHMCYVCKIKIKDYSHFDQSPAGQPAQKKNLCRLWEDTIQRNKDEVKAAAQKTLQELQTQDPDLAAQVRLDIPK